jgi:hypothetical protein
MHTGALALGWELWARHRWGWAAVGAGVLVAGVLARVLPAGPARTVGDVAMVLSLLVYPYLLSIFVYAEATLGGKAAGFPPRLFTLPMRTSLLVAWPMLYGTAAAALWWLGLSFLILIPCGLWPSVTWWPALLAAAGLACFQALCWTFVRTPLLRLVAAILGLPSVFLAGALVWATYRLQITLTQLNLGLGALIAAAYVVAVAGVTRDRRGDRLGWAWLGRLLLRAVPRWPAQERPFSSPLAAQRWLEVRRHAWLLPAFVGLFVALLFFWATALPLGPAEVARVAVAVVCVPALLAFVVGFGMGKTSFWARDLGLSSFLATRPLTSAELARAKLQAAALSALAAWGLVLLLAPVWALASGNVEILRRLGDALWHGEPTWRLGLLAPVALAGLVGLTWLQLVAGMGLSLTGRPWVVNAVVLLYAAVGTALLGLGLWTANHADFLDTLLLVLRCLGGGLGFAKLSAAAWTLCRSDFWRDGTLAWLALWLAVAVCLLAPLYAVLPTSPVPTHLVALFVLLALPLTRLAALPAAVAWNRHR